MITRRTSFAALAGAAAAYAQKQTGNLPNVGFKADVVPARSEAGVGAMLPWADSLWAVTYNSHTRRTGTGLALHRIEADLTGEPVHFHDGTHANRLVHKESSQAIVGPYVIDPKGNFRFIERFRDERLTSTMRHLKDPANLVYMLTMEGMLYEMDVRSLQVRLVTDVVKQFNINKRPHFKGGYTAQGRTVITNNGFYAYGDMEAGLFEFDGSQWRALSRKPHMDVAAREDMGNVMFATGWDERSVLFWALIDGQWRRYRLPKASHAMEHAWQTEWMRIREVETEHFMMDIQGMFYELQPIAFENSIWGVKPICQHLRIVPDYCAFRGLLALGGNQTTPNNDNNALSGQPQSGIWFGKTDDLWQWGKPAGWGGPWRKTVVKAGEASDPYLMTGFQRKMVHLKSDKLVNVGIEVDFLGDGSWEKYESMAISGYRRHIFPEGFSAHWVRFVPDGAATLTAELFYS
jgi:hypothetical protein